MTDSPSRGWTRWSRRILAGLTIVLAGLLIYGLLSPGQPNRVSERLAEGKAAPAPAFGGRVLDVPASQVVFQLTAGQGPDELRMRVRGAVEDRILTLDELRGVPVVLNFWASWCGFCRTEAPVLEQGWRRDRRRGVLYLGLNMEDAAEDARAFLDDFGVSYPVVYEPNDEVGRSFGATGLPETFFLDGRGRVVGRVIGEIDRGLLRRGVAAALEGRPVGNLSASAGRRRIPF